MTSGRTFSSLFSAQQPQILSAMAMDEAAARLLLVKPAVPAPLDPNFCPLVLGKRNYLKAVAGGAQLSWALPRSDGCARYSLPVFPEESSDVGASIYLAGVLIQDPRARPSKLVIHWWTSTIVSSTQHGMIQTPPEGNTKGRASPCVYTTQKLLQEGMPPPPWLAERFSI